MIFCLFRTMDNLGINTIRKWTGTDIEEMRDEISSFVVWYNCFRPHQGLKGRFPIERYLQKTKRKRKYRVRGDDPEKVNLSVSYFDDKNHLPIVRLRKVG